MPLKVSDRHVVLDTETTGLKAGVSAVIEIGAVMGVWRSDEDGVAFHEISTFNSICNPGIKYLTYEAKDALEVNGHSLAAIQRAGPIEEVAMAFHKWIGEWSQDKGVQLHAYNIPFDSAFLAREPWHVPPWAWGEDVMIAASWTMGRLGEMPKKKRGGGYRFPKLIRAAEFFEIELPKEGRAHTALYDALMTARVYEAVQREDLRR